jgi:long-chain acyl-CoA synthetase
MTEETLYTKIEKIGFKNPHQAVFRYKKNNQWTDLTYADYINKSKKLAFELHQKGLRKGDIVLSYTNNCIELNILDLALLQMGVVHAMCFPNYTETNLIEVIDYLKPKIIFCGGGVFISSIIKTKNSTTELFEIYTLSEKSTKATSIYSLMESGNSISKNINFEVSSNDIYSIYFTSGTTGKTKGAVVRNSAISKTIEHLKKIFPLNNNETSISIAPLSVSSERCLNYFYQCAGVTTYYPESMEQLIFNIQDAKPSIFLTSPLMLNKIRDNVYLKLEDLNGFKKIIFKKALEYVKNDAHINPEAFLSKIQKIIFEKLIFSKLREILGGRVKYIVSGGAASSKETLVFYHNIGIPVFEGYGMTECHIISVNHPLEKNNKFDNVGKPFGNTEIKISEDGEILCKSPYMYDSYYKQPDINIEAFTNDKYFKTGDKGVFDNDGNLKIIGRIKSIFKTQAGIYINPEGIEAFLNHSQNIQQSAIVGENKPFLCALICPSENLKEKPFNDVYKLVESDINQYNSTKTQAEQILKFVILTTPFTIEKEELTASGKPIRKKIESNYKNQIGKIYGTQ